MRESWSGWSATDPSRLTGGGRGLASGDAERGTERTADPYRPRHADGRDHAQLLAALRAGRGISRRAPGQGNPRPRRGPGRLPRRRGALRRARPALRPPRRRPGLRALRGRGAALPLSRLALRLRRSLSGAARRAGRLDLSRARPPARLSLRRTQRHRLRLYGRRRGAAAARLRLVRRAGQPLFRVQGAAAGQLAAGGRGRDRPGASFLPAPLSRRRRRGRWHLRLQAVPRRGGRFRRFRHHDPARGAQPAGSRSRGPISGSGSSRCATGATSPMCG